MNKIEQFISEVFGEVRASKVDGVLYFVAQDIARVLDYRMASDMTRNLEDEDVHTQSLRTDVGEREFNVITESGLYDAVLSITKRNQERYKKARLFKRWITSEVIPTIRETGGYVEDNREDEFVNKYFPSFSEEVKLVMIKDLMNTNKELKVKANRWDKFLDSNSTYTFTEVAKMISTKVSEEQDETIKISNQSLTKYLRDKGVLSKNKSGKKFTNVPNKEYEDYFNVISRNVKDLFDATQTKVKSNGVEFIYDMLILDEFDTASTELN